MVTARRMADGLWVADLAVGGRVEASSFGRDEADAVAQLAQIAPARLAWLDTERRKIGRAAEALERRARGVRAAIAEMGGGGE
jgi:hypothetical protein